MIVYLPLLVCIVGLILYLIPTDAKVYHAKANEVGRIMFAFGLLVTLLNAAAITMGPLGK